MAKDKISRPRKGRSDSTRAATEALDAAMSVISPPDGVNINDDEYKFWRMIISSRAAGSWTENDLMMAAMLARCYSDIEKYSLSLSSSRLIKDSSGNPKISPAHKIVDDLCKQVLSISRTLQIHPRATQGESRDQHKRNDLHNSKIEAIKNVNGDDLIPGLH